MAELIRQVGISDQTFYCWKKQYAGLQVDQVRQLKQLQEENGRLKRLHRRERFRPTAPNQVWSMDFVADQLADGRRFRALTVMDTFTRESLAIEVGQSLKGADGVPERLLVHLTGGCPADDRGVAPGAQ